LAKRVQNIHWSIAWFLAIAVALAQLGALSHTYSHIPALTAGQSCAAAASVQPSNRASHDYCGDCLSFAPLLSMGGTAWALLAITPVGRLGEPNAQAPSVAESPLTLAFRSRAPPTLS